MSQLCQNQAPGDETCNAFFLPTWFLANNVKTPAELNSLQPPSSLLISDVDNASQGTPSIDKNNAPKDNVDKALHADKRQSSQAASGRSRENSNDTNGTLDHKVDMSEPQVAYDKFSELRDVTASLLIRHQQGRLCQTHPSVLLNCSLDNSLPFVDRVVQHLARDLQATLVSVDLQDLEDLAWEFRHQEQRKDAENPEQEPNPNWFKGMAMQYFGAPSQRHASENAWNKSKKAIQAILDTQLSKSCSRTTSENNPEATHVTSPAPLVDELPPLIVYFRVPSEIDKPERWDRIPARFWNFIRDRRLSGYGVVFLTSAPTFLPSRLHDKISRDNAFKVTITSSSLTKGKTFSIQNNLASDINTRRLKRFLRWCVPSHLFHPELVKHLLPGSAWTLEDDGRYECVMLHESAWTVQEDETDEYASESQWSETHFQNAITQVTGRAFGKPHLDLDDVRIVLLRMGMLKTVSKIEQCQAKQASSEGTEKQRASEGTEKLASETMPAQFWGHKLDRIQSTADKYEQSLIQCIINPDDMQCTYDDVIVDQDTKDTVRHLVSLSHFRPEATSAFLMKQLRINGALFYGPPGTGKTHLCRAIAHASGASMLALDSATIRSPYVGQTEKRIKAAFTLANKMFPCVLFIDEVDSLFYSRSSKDKTWERSALAQFLLEMDGLSKSDTAPFVVGATNRPEDLDDAFYRRLPQKIFFGLPDEESRCRILQLFVKQGDLDPLVDVGGLARQTAGYSGSDLRSLCAEAALIWAVEEVKMVPMGEKMGRLRLNVSHFARALKKIRPSVSSDTMRRLSRFSRQFGAEPAGGAFEDTGLAFSADMDPELAILYDSSIP